MARFLRWIGLMVLAAATVVLIAGEAGAIPAATVDLVFVPALQAGGIAFAAGVVLSLLAPFGRMATQGRCVRCGTRIEKGQTYCHDHLKTAVQEFTDRSGGVT